MSSSYQKAITKIIINIEADSQIFSTSRASHFSLHYKTMSGSAVEQITNVIITSKEAEPFTIDKEQLSHQS